MSDCYSIVTKPSPPYSLCYSKGVGRENLHHHLYPPLSLSPLQEQ